MFRNKFFTIAVFAALFIGLSLLITFGGFIVEAVSGYGQDKKELPLATYPHLAQNLQNDLNTAMAPEFAFNFDSAGNPFADKTGVSVSVGDNRGNNTVPMAAGMPGNRPPGLPAGSPVMPVQSLNGGMPGGMPAPTPVNNILTAPQPAVASVDSKALIQERNRQIRQGKDVADLATLYSVDEVRPIGIIGTGNNNKIWLYSPSTKQSFTVRRGARLHDGTIESVSAEGVEFKRDNGTIGVSRWMKNSEKSAGENSDAPLLRVQESSPAPIVQPIESASNPSVFPARPRRNRKVNN